MLSYIKQGDCLELMKEIPDGSVDMILCDLPFQVTQNKWDKLIDTQTLWREYNRVIKHNGAILLFAIPPFSSIISNEAIYMFRYSWYWHKPHTGQLNAKRMPLKNVEEILVFYHKQPTYNPQFSIGEPYTVNRKNYKGSSCYGSQKDHSTVNNGFRYPTQILDFKVEQGGGCKRLHPTQKPIALCEYLIKTYTNEGEVVLDNCMGSGTTCIAAINTNRKYIGFELNQDYFEIAQRRIEEASHG